MGYFDIGRLIGVFTAILTFIISYIYCISSYGFLFGLGLGWLPSGILAVLVFFATILLWMPALLIIAFGILMIVTHH